MLTLFTKALFASILGGVQGLPTESSEPEPPTATGIAPKSTQNAVELAKGLTQSDMTDAFPPRDPAKVQNWYGTSLFGWQGCNKDSAWKRNIKEAYSDANKLVNFDGVRRDIDWESAAALEFLGPSLHNKGEQAQIQSVLENVATVYEGSTVFTPNWIRVRCDDPRNLCQSDPPDCPPPSAKSQPGVTIASSRNPFENGNDRFSEINFCPEFFKRRSLTNGMAYGSAPHLPYYKANLDDYFNRANVFLHELFHLDLAAKSKNNNPNPQIHDLKIKYRERQSDDKYKEKTWTSAYGPTMAKVLARFQPKRRGVTVGYWVQRNADSYTNFALASYIQEKLGFYPYRPVVYDEIIGTPRDPKNPNTLNGSDIITFQTDSAGSAYFVNITDDSPNDCLAISGNLDNVDVEIGAPSPKSLYPDSYWKQHNQWVEEIKNATGVPVSGTCKLKIKEIWTCEAAENNLYAQMSVYGNSGSLIYSTPGTTDPPGVPINDAKPYKLKEGDMKEDLVIVGEHRNDYIQFTYGDQFWQSSTTKGTPSCVLKSDDSWKPPTCEEASTRSFECTFKC